LNWAVDVLLRKASRRLGSGVVPELDACFAALPGRSGGPALERVAIPSQTIIELDHWSIEFADHTQLIWLIWPIGTLAPGNTG